MIKLFIESINEIKDSDVEIAYMRNLDTNTAYYGSRFGQNLEPSGEYMIMDTLYNDHLNKKYLIPNYEYGFISFKKPLILDFINTADTGWKKTLSDRYKGKTGKRLSTAITKDGYDGIITMDGNDVSEIVNLNGIKHDSYRTGNNIEDIYRIC